MKAVPGTLAAHDGQILSDGKISFRIPNGVAYEAIFLYTNLPKEAFKRITVANGNDERIKTSGVEIVNLKEKIWGRTVDLGNDPLPIRFNTPDALTNNALNAYPLFTTPRDSWLLEIEFGTLGTPPAGGFYIRPKTLTSSLLTKNNAGQYVTRRELFRQRTKTLTFTAVEGENVFDKTPVGVNAMYQAIHIKGNVTEVKFEGYIGGQIAYKWELEKDFNDYLIKTRGQKTGAKPADGYFNIFPTASGFTLGDMEGLNYDRVDLILQVATAGQIEITYDLIELVG